MKIFDNIYINFISDGVRREDPQEEINSDSPRNREADCRERGPYLLGETMDENDVRRIYEVNQQIFI